jgi:tripartite-type tricarboxylate transporter receptor subunit TctC
MASLNIGRPYMLPPGVPAERVAALRKAFQDTFADPEFRADAANLRIDIDAAPKTGAEIQKIVADTYRAPQNVVDRLRRLFAAVQ